MLTSSEKEAFAEGITPYALRNLIYDGTGTFGAVTSPLGDMRSEAKLCIRGVLEIGADDYFRMMCRADES